MKVRVLERIKQGEKWTMVPVKVKLDGTLYLKDERQGKFLLVWMESGKKRYSELFTQLYDVIKAREKKQAYLNAISHGIEVKDPVVGTVKPTIDDSIDTFLEQLTGRGNTVALYTTALRTFQEWNRSRRHRIRLLDAIDRPCILAFKRYLESEIGNDEYTAVWKCLRLNKMIKDTLKLEPGKGPVSKRDFAEVLNRKPTVTTYSKEEVDQFLSQCKGRNKIIFTLLLKCGLRSRELTHLEWTDVDLKRRVVHIRRKIMLDGDRQIEFRPKKWSVRSVALPLDLTEALERTERTCNLVFPTRHQRIDLRIWDKCKRIAQKAGLDVKKFMPKNFRSTHATNRLRNGYTLAEIREGLGHRDLHSVEHYLAAMAPDELVRTGRVDAGW
ncbi:MAG TPA: tyrosine-type recombinase/integrase [Candidatus Angelobacter sp.]|nr:tyrosine-type recombinase/integrase [Candidatus Angelobacter sp.]